MNSDHCPVVLTLDNSILNNQYNYKTPIMEARLQQYTQKQQQNQNKKQKSISTFFTTNINKKQKT